MLTPSDQYRGVKTVIISLVAALAVVGGSAVGYVLYLQETLSGKIQHFGDPFEQLQARPASASAPINFLLLGSDTRISPGDAAQWDRGADHLGAIMVAQLSADRKSAAILSLPPQVRVNIPGYGEHRIDTAFSSGGPSLTVHTVEELTGIRIDHVVVADFESFVALTDSVGGVEVELVEPLHVAGEEVPQGKQVLDGAQMLAYVLQPGGPPENGLTQLERRQAWLESIMHAIHGSGVLSDPVKIGPFLSSVGQTLAVDDSLTVSRIRDIAFAARDLGVSNTTFITAPTAGIARSPDDSESVVILDEDAFTLLANSFANGTIQDYLAQNREVIRVGHSATD